MGCPHLRRPGRNDPWSQPPSWSPWGAVEEGFHLLSHLWECVRSFCLWLIKFSRHWNFLSHHVCRPSLLRACYTIQHVGCWELICDLYQSFAHQLWVGSTSAACGTSIEVSTGIVCSLSHIPPPCWRTHGAIAASLIALDGPFLPPCHSLLFLALGPKLNYTSHPHPARHAQTFDMLIVLLPVEEQALSSVTEIVRSPSIGGNHPSC